jgi:SAM-dependent methyltransferase
MHASAYAFAVSALSAADVAGALVAEAGSRNVNGSVRSYVESLCPAGYVGVDLEAGPGVDVLADAADLPSLGEFDVVISTEMLEHAPDWRGAMAGLVGALAPGGILVITTRSPGFPVHDYPSDCWRYTLADMKAILDGAGLVTELLQDDDPVSPGVLARARKPDGWAWPDQTGWDSIELARPG